MRKLAQSVLLYTRKHDLLRAGDRVAVAVSGGADSVALLRLMLETRDDVGLVVSVVHLNHQLRGAESDLDEAFVRELADAHRLELISRRCDVNEQAAENNMSIEAAARRLRYKFFHEILGQDACSKIATAHTLDDQAETVLLKLARGAGTRGIAGIWPKVAVSHQPSAVSDDAPKVDDRRPTTGTIIRPLLSTRRSVLREYLVALGQTWREDSSNRDLRHTRNRIRHGILPRLERHVNPNVLETLAGAAEIARAEEEYWAREIERWLPQAWMPDARGGSVDRKLLERFPLAVRRRLLRAAAESFGLDLRFEHVERILGLEVTGSRCFLVHRWSAQLEGGEIKFRQHTILGKEPKDNKYGVKFTQMHAVDLIDMDGDGLKDIVTGKRFWAHGAHGDPEPNNPAVLYWFKLVRPAKGQADFIPYLIDNDSGVGTQLIAGHISNKKFPDVVVGNKKGVFVFEHETRNVSHEEWQKAQPKLAAP